MFSPERIAIVVSQTDRAGMNIKKALIEQHRFLETNENTDGFNVFRKWIDDRNIEIKLYTKEIESIYCENIDKEIDADMFIFATKHQGCAGIRTLSAHTPGNWGNAEMGGRSRNLCIAPPDYLKAVLKELEKRAHSLGFEVGMEQTHHGPYLGKPVLFVEIGSTPLEWENPLAASAIASAVISVVSGEVQDFRPAIVLGGGHYSHYGLKLQLKTNLAAGHICAKHMLEFFDEEMLNQAVEKTLGDNPVIVLDWKGLGKEKSRIVEMLKTHNNFEVIRSDKL